jgi:hypothetical protein
MEHFTCLTGMIAQDREDHVGFLVNVAKDHTVIKKILF